jgi:hypothetical protein
MHPTLPALNHSFFLFPFSLCFETSQKFVFLVALFLTVTLSLTSLNSHSCAVFCSVEREGAGGTHNASLRLSGQEGVLHEFAIHFEDF